MAETAVAKQPSQKALAVKNFKAVLDNSYYQEQLKNVMNENAVTFSASLL